MSEEEEAGPQEGSQDDSPFRPVASSRPYERGQRKSGRLFKVCFFLGVLVTAIGLIMLHIFTSYLIPSPDNICDAASDGNLFKVKLLLWRDPDLHKARGGSLDSTPLHNAADHGHKGILEYLISEGADVNARNYYRHTPLHDAASAGRADIVKILLEAGADPNVKGNDGDTPLSAAIEGKHTEVADLLRRHGAKQ